MNHSIIENNSHWLRNFANKQTDKKLISLTLKLNTELLEAKSANHAQTIISKYLFVNEYYPYAVLATDVLYKKITEWHNHLTLLESRLKSAREALAIADTQPITIRPLIALATEVLDNSQSLLHSTMLSFLTLLSSTSIQDTLLYLANLDKAPAPIKPSPGTFAALTPLTRNHAACIQLIINTSVAIDLKNARWEQANSLLQNLLLIHKDLNIPDLELLEQEATPVCCVIS